MADLPRVAVEIGFDVAGTPQNIGSDYAAIVWTDVTADVRPDPALTFNRGRPEAGQPAAAGQLTVTLLNSDGDYTPGDNGGTYGAIHTRMPIRVVADAGGYASEYSADYAHSTSLWVGFITDIDYTLDGGQALVTVTASDIIAAAARTTCAAWMDSRIIRGTGGDLVAYWPLTDPAPNGLGNSSANTVPMLSGETLLPKWGTAALQASGPDAATLSCNVLTGDLSPENQPNIALTPTTVGSFTYGKILSADLPDVTSSGPYAVSVWVRPTSTSLRKTVFALSDGGGELLSVACLPPGSGVSTTAEQILVVENSSTSNLGSTTTLLPYGQWSHIYLDYDGSDFTCYVNGTASATSAYTPTRAGAALKVSLGGPLSTIYGWDGQLAHLAVWDSSDPTRITALRDRGDTQPTAADRFIDLAELTANPTGLATWMSADAAADNPISAQAPTGKTLLAVAQEVADAERGSIVASKDGKLALLAQRGTAAAADPLLTLSAEADILAIDGLFGVDDADNINAATVTLQPSGRAFTVTRATDPGIESTSLELWTTSEAFAQTLASALANADTQTPRAPSLTLSMDWLAHADVAVAAVELDLGDTIAVTDLPASAPASSLTVQVRSITHTIAKDSWTVQVDTDPPNSLGILDDTDLGKLDDTMILGV